MGRQPIELHVNTHRRKFSVALIHVMSMLEAVDSQGVRETKKFRCKEDDV